MDRYFPLSQVCYRFASSLLRSDSRSVIGCSHSTLCHVMMLDSCHNILEYCIGDSVLLKLHVVVITITHCFYISIHMIFNNTAVVHELASVVLKFLPCTHLYRVFGAMQPRANRHGLHPTPLRPTRRQRGRSYLHSALS